MKNLALGTAAVLLVAACGGDASSNDTSASQDASDSAMTMDEVASAAASSDVKPMPGKYRSDVELISLDMPGAPPQVADMMRGRMSRSFDYCLTQDDVDEGFKEMTRKSQEGDCTFQRFDATGGNIDAEMTCKTGGGTMTMVMEGTGTPTSSDVTMTMSGDMGMGPTTMKFRAQHERIGDC
ncbi:DUF3617 domain-containing protein [Erythrobacter sp. GH1-10]|uniref:DUF3617 domain-containing protein n=1 Tax=Erythrobacter sp. GH1-10 TaxID=3349334 RepID=UPI003877EAC0